MTSGAPESTVDQRLDAFMAAWHAGQGPIVAAHLEASPADQRHRLGELIAAFLELAPTVIPTPAVAASKLDEPLVARLSAIEGDWWDAGQASPPATT